MKRCAVTLGCVLAASLVRYGLSPFVGEEFPFLSFIAAALVATSYGGIISGMVALLLGLLLADFFFLPPLGHIGGPSHQGQQLEFIRYFVTALLGILLIEILHRARMRAERAAAGLREEVLRRQQSEADLLEAKAQISRHADELEARVAERTAKLEATLESLQSVLYHIAHDLRAPLRTMHGFTTALVNEYAPHLDAAGKDYAHRVGDAAQRMDRLIQDLLDYGRVGHMELNLVPVDLQAAVQRAVSRLAQTVQAEGAQIEVAAPLPQVIAHEPLLDRILVNLLDNSLKFVAPEVTPRIRFGASQHDGIVRFWIEDNGIGIKPEHHERIFQLFERLHDAHTYEGTGIGLAIVDQGMQHMKGRVELESQPGRGSKFYLELPAAQAEE